MPYAERNLPAFSRCEVRHGFLSWGKNLNHWGSELCPLRRWRTLAVERVILRI